MPSAPADGDSLGSALALYLILKKLGKEVTVVSPEPVPEAFQFLPTTNVIHEDLTASPDFIVTIDCAKAKIDTIKTKLENNKVNIIVTAKKGQFSADEVSFHHGPSKYDVIVTVDTGDLVQLGRFYEDNPELFTSLPVINIDHHASNDNFGKINLVDIMASATTEILLPLIEEMEQRTNVELFDEDVATLLLAGIITDTGSFQNANTTPRSFAASAKLIKYGARQQEIIKHVFKTKHLSTLRLWGRILTNIKLDQKYRFVWTTLSLKDFSDTESREDETGGIIDELLTNAPGTEVVLLLKQKTDGVISGSVRTTSASIDASKIAGMFGGGGHVQAAGFKIQSNDLAGTEAMVIEKIKAFQKEHLKLSETEEEATGAGQLGGGAQMPGPTMQTGQIPQFGQIGQSAPAEKANPTATANDFMSGFTAMPKPEPEVEKAAVLPEFNLEKKFPNDGEEEESVEKTTPNHAESFTDVIIRKATSHDKGDTFNLDPNMTYKFEE